MSNDEKQEQPEGMGETVRPPVHNGVVFSAICRIDGKSTVLSSPVFENPAAPEVGDAERFFAGRLFYATETVEDFRALVLDVCKDKGVETGCAEDARSVCIARDLWDFACGSGLPDRETVDFPIQIILQDILEGAWQSASVVYVVNLADRDYVFSDVDDEIALFAGASSPRVFVEGTPLDLVKTGKYVDENPVFTEGLSWPRTKDLMREIDALSSALHKAADGNPTDENKELIRLMSVVEKTFAFWKRARDVLVKEYVEKGYKKSSIGRC